MIVWRLAATALAVFLTFSGILGSPRLAAQAPVEGEYCLSGVREVGSCFRLSGGGGFEYFLAYGAYDEVSQGQWRLDGDAVVLESLPFDMPARFSFLRHEPGVAEGVQVTIVSQAGKPLQGFDVDATCEGRKTTAPASGHVYPLACGGLPGEINVGLGILGLAAQSLKVPPPASGERAIVVAFEPGDLGKRRFANARLSRDGDALLLVYVGAPFPEMEGARLRYVRNR